jgi:hypothetical protein
MTTRIPLAALCGIEIGTGENIMKIKGLVFIELPRSRHVDRVAGIKQAGKETGKQFVAVAANGWANDTGDVEKPLSAKSAKRELAHRQHAPPI